MRYLFLALFTFISFALYSQPIIYTPTGHPKGLNRILGGQKIDSVLIIPVRDTTEWYDTLGNLTIRPQDGMLYFKGAGSWLMVANLSYVDSALAAITFDTAILDNYIKKYSYADSFDLSGNKLKFDGNQVYLNGNSFRGFGNSFGNRGGGLPLQLVNSYLQSNGNKYELNSDSIVSNGSSYGGSGNRYGDYSTEIPYQYTNSYLKHDGGRHELNSVELFMGSSSSLVGPSSPLINWGGSGSKFRMWTSGSDTIYSNGDLFMTAPGSTLYLGDSSKSTESGLKVYSNADFHGQTSIMPEDLFTYNPQIGAGIFKVSGYSALDTNESKNNDYGIQFLALGTAPQYGPVSIRQKKIGLLTTAYRGTIDDSLDLKWLLPLESGELVTNQRLQARMPNGENGQIPKVTTGSNYISEDLVNIGQFVSSDAQLSTSTQPIPSFITVFNSWKRFSHGATVGLDNSLSDTIPARYGETSTFSFVTSTQTIRSTVNSATYIGFVSNTKLNNYQLKSTVKKGNGDDDYVGLVIAYMEDSTDLVPNNAYGLSPSPGIDVTHSTIPNQHTLSVMRGRARQKVGVGADSMYLGDDSYYFIVYDYGKHSQKIIAKGSSLLSYNPVRPAGIPPAEVDIKIIRTPNTISTYTTEWSDAPLGKGELGFELGVDLDSDPVLAKFKNPCSYGFSTFSQSNTGWDSLDAPFNSGLSVYDLRNGDVYQPDSAGIYHLSSDKHLNDDYTMRSFFYNPLYHVLFYQDGNGAYHEFIDKPYVDSLNTGIIGSYILLTQKAAANGVATLGADTNLLISQLPDTALMRQRQLNGTGFVVQSGTTTSYDNTVYTPGTRTISAGNGLTGGGNLTANRTLTLGTPSTISPTSTNNSSGSTHNHQVQGFFTTDAWSGVSTTTNQVINLDSINYSGLVYAGAGSTGLPSGITNAHVWTSVNAGGGGMQWLVNHVNNDVFWMRRKNTGTWGAWVQVASRDYVTANFASLTKLNDTIRLYAKHGGNALGSSLSIGTSDANTLNFRTNNTNRLVLLDNSTPTLEAAAGGSQGSFAWGTSSSGFKSQRNINDAAAVHTFNNANSSSTGNLISATRSDTLKFSVDRMGKVKTKSVPAVTSNYRPVVWNMGDSTLCSVDSATFSTIGYLPKTFPSNQTVNTGSYTLNIAGNNDISMSANPGINSYLKLYQTGDVELSAENVNIIEGGKIVSISTDTLRLNTSGGGGYYSDFQTDGLTANRKQSFTDADGTIPVTLNTTANIDFASIAQGSSDVQTATVTGANVGDIVVLGLSATAATCQLQFKAYVSSPNTVSIVAWNYASVYDLTAQDFKIMIIK